MKWKIAMFREPQSKPFDHKFQVTAPNGEQWVARTLAAAIRLVDSETFKAAHPELQEVQA
jgi:hypothetical protein